MDLRDCPHNYITAFQKPFELHALQLGDTTALHSYHSSTVECAMTDMALMATFEQGSSPWDWKPPHPSAYKLLDLKQRVGTVKTKDQTCKAPKT